LPNLYIIAGCNGAGKTTASYTVLPEVLGCKEFVNADEIAKGLSPFQPETVSFEAGRIMLDRIRELVEQRVDFAFETTLATRSYVTLLKEAKLIDYKIILVFFWLESPQLAKERVKLRVSRGGHNIPEEIIERRYIRGINNFFELYEEIVDGWGVYNNSGYDPYLIAKGTQSGELHVYDPTPWDKFNRYYEFN
jgi:predicted ABC-type ATPase